MTRQGIRRIATAALLFALISGGAAAQKPGGVLRIYHRDSPASMSVHEEGTNSVSIPMMAVFNNLVLFDQHISQKQPRGDPPRSRRQLVVERRRQAAHVQAASRRQMA